MHCKDCKHWKTHAETIGSCERVKPAGQTKPPEVNLRDEKAYTVDSSSYWSGLRTRPDFGCVLYENKNQLWVDCTIDLEKVIDDIEQPKAEDIIKSVQEILKKKVLELHQSQNQEKMFFRPHWGSLSEAMGKMVLLPKTKEALENHVKEIFKDFKDYWSPEDIKVQLYSHQPDTRIGWEKTYIVFDKVGFVIGFTNKEV